MLTTPPSQSWDALVSPFRAVVALFACLAGSCDAMGWLLTAPFLFEFQRYGMSSEEFYSCLDTCFGQLPNDFRYAVEIRNAGLLGPAYRKVLAGCGKTLVFTDSLA